MKPCHILCTDGRVVSYNEYMSQKKTAIGVVFYVNQSGSTEHEGTGYAVYLWDVDPEAFADSIGTKQNTSADISKYDGNTNTFAIFNTNTMGSPLANKVFNMWHYGLWLKCACSIRTSPLSMSTLENVVETLFQIIPMSVGIGHPRR